MPAPSGPISVVTVALQKAIAATAVFQAATNTVGNATAAEEWVKLHAWSVEDVLFEEFHLHRPFAIVNMPQLVLHDNGLRCYRSSGSALSVYLSMDHTAANHNDGWVEFANFCGDLLVEAITNGGPYEDLPSFELRSVVEPSRVPRSERNPDHDFWGAAFSLTITE